MKSPWVFKADPCPNCGKEDAARRGNTSWGHQYMCCSEKCGLEYRDSVKRARAELKEAEAKRDSAQRECDMWEASIKKLESEQ